ncbi:MAG: hypothetical protein ABH884_00680 [Candidatus Komeilibacteria bacterium]
MLVQEEIDRDENCEAYDCMLKVELALFNERIGQFTEDEFSFTKDANKIS